MQYCCLYLKMPIWEEDGYIPWEQAREGRRVAQWGVRYDYTNQAHASRVAWAVRAPESAALGGPPPGVSWLISQLSMANQG